MEEYLIISLCTTSLSISNNLVQGEANLTFQNPLRFHIKFNTQITLKFLAKMDKIREDLPILEQAHNYHQG